MSFINEFLSRLIKAGEEMGLEEIIPVDMLIVILDSYIKVKLEVAKACGIKASAFAEQVNKAKGISFFSNKRWRMGVARPPTLSESAQNCIRNATALAEQTGTTLSAYHLVYVIVRDHPNDAGIKYLINNGLDANKIYGLIRKTIYGMNAVLLPDELSRVLVDMIANARQGSYQPIVGRDEEIKRLIEALSQTTRNFPVLVGPPGVGKTALVEGLALYLVESQLDQERLSKLIGSGLFFLPYSVYAEQVRRGNGESLIKTLIAFLRDSRSVLFLDEVHAFFTGQETRFAAEALKYPLSRGEIRIIGTTTSEEYTQLIQAYPPLERRLSVIRISEPDAEKTLQMVKTITPRLEAHYGITIDDAVLQRAVELSQWLPHLHAPDRVVNLLDAAAAFRHVSQSARTSSTLDELDLIETLHHRFGVPQFGVQTPSLDEMRQLVDEINTEVYGQARAIEECVGFLWNSYSARRKRPLTCAFIGPESIGKRRIAQIIARRLMSNAFIYMDMSDMTTDYSLTRLIGAPPGYIGYGDVHPLIASLHTNPYQVVALENINLAHPSVQDFLAAAIQKGSFESSQGRTVHLETAIIILLINVPQQASMIVHGGEDKPRPALKNLLVPSLINAVDRIITFAPMDKPSAITIAAHRLSMLKEQYQEKHGITLTYEDDFAARLVEEIKGLNAQAVIRRIGEKVELALMHTILQHRQLPARIHMAYRDGEVVFSISRYNKEQDAMNRVGGVAA